MSRPDKRVHYDAMLAGTAKKHDSVRLAAWSNFTAGYQVTLMPTDTPIIIKTKPTDPVGNLFASAEKWQPFARRFFDIRPNAHACYLVDASALCTSSGNGIELQEISRSQALGEVSRPIRNVVSRLNPRLSTIVAAGGLPALLALKMCVFSGFPCVADIVRRIVLFLPSPPQNWEKSLLRGMKTAWETQPGTSMKKMSELVIVVASAQEGKMWSTESLKQVNPFLSAFFEVAFTKMSVETLPAIGGNPLVHFANMLYNNNTGNTNKNSAPVLPPNRFPELGIFEIRFMLSKYTKHVEQEVDALLIDDDDDPTTNINNKNQNGGEDEDDDDDDERVDAIENDDDIEEQEEEAKQEGDKQQSTSAAAAAAVPLSLSPLPNILISQLSQLFYKNNINNNNNNESCGGIVDEKIPVRLAGLVLDGEGNIGNAHGIVNITPASSLTSFIGKMVKLIADVSFQNGKMILSSPRQILRVQSSEKESLLAVSIPSNVPPVSHSKISRRYGCVLMRGRKLVLTRESASAQFMRYPSDTRKNITETPIECASRAICTQLDVTPDNFTILSDLPPVVTFEKVVNFLNPKDSETIITTLFLAVTIQCPGGPARDAIEEEMTLEDNYDWLTSSQAEQLLVTKDEKKALKDASEMIRRCCGDNNNNNNDNINLFSWPEGFGLLGDPAKPFNDTVCAFVHTPFLDASAEAAASCLSSMFEALPSEQVQKEILASSSSGDNNNSNKKISSVLSTFLTKKVVDPSVVAKHCARSSSHVTLVPLPTSVSFAHTVFDIAPSVKRRNWAESRQVTVLSPSARVLAAFDGSENDVDVVAVAEDILEHSDEIIVVLPSSKSANGTNNNNDDDENQEDQKTITKTLLALLYARKNDATAVWTATTTTTTTISSNNEQQQQQLQIQIQPEFSKKILASWIRPPNSVRDPGPRYVHQNVFSFRPYYHDDNTNTSHQEQKPLNPITLSNLASEEMVEEIRKMNLVHVKGSAWVAGCQTHPVRMTLRGGSDWNFIKADKPFSTPQPCHDLEMIFCTTTTSNNNHQQQQQKLFEEMKQFWKSLECKEGDSFMNESELDILPGWSNHDHDNEEEEEDDELDE